MSWGCGVFAQSAEFGEQVGLPGGAFSVGQKRRNLWHGYARELVRFELMKSSAVYPTFPEKLVGCNSIERLPDAADEARIARHGAGKDWCRIHRKVNVGHSRARVIQDEAKRSPAFGIATPDISADDRRGRPGLLAVPERAVLTEVPFT